MWVELGGRLGFSDAVTEKVVFQKLLDGGVYIVSMPRDAAQADLHRPRGQHTIIQRQDGIE